MFFYLLIMSRMSNLYCIQRFHFTDQCGTVSPSNLMFTIVANETR